MPQGEVELEGAGQAFADLFQQPDPVPFAPPGGR